MLSLLCESHITRTAKEAEAKKALLTKAEESLREIVAKTKNLFSPINKILEKENVCLADATTKLLFKEIDQKIGVDNLFLPLCNVTADTLEKPFEALSAYVNELMADKEPSIGWPFLGLESLNDLDDAVTTLRETRYKDVYLAGGTLQSKNDEVTKVREALQEFIKVFFRVLEEGVNTALVTTSQRVSEVFSRCMDVVLKQMQEDCRKIDSLKEFESLLRVFCLTLTFKRLDELQIKVRYKFPRIERVEKSKAHSWIEDRFEVPSLESIMIVI